MERTTFICDVCGAEKKDANHWWVLLVNQFGFHLTSMDICGGPDPKKEHLCGQECAVQRLSEFMSRPAHVASTNPPPALAALAGFPTATDTSSQQTEKGENEQ